MGAKWPIEKVADLQSRGVLLVEDGNHGEYRPRRCEFAPAGTAFIRAADMADGRVLFESAEHINEIALSRIRKGIGAGGDILLSHKGTVGKVARVPNQAPPFVCSPQTTLWRTLDENVIDRDFLYSYMRSTHFRDLLQSRQNETDMAAYVSLTAQRDFEIPVPSIDIQRDIAELLTPLDDKIELNRQMNHTLEVMARAIFKAWFVDFEPVKAKAAGAKSFPGMPQAVFDQLPDRFTDTELWPVPAGWEVKPLDEIADFLNGVALQKYPASDNEDSLPVIKIAELRNGISPNTGRASRQVPSKYIIKDGDFIFSWSGSLLAKFWAGGEGALNQHLFKVTSATHPLWFVSQWVQYHLEAFQAIASSKATTMGHIQRRHLKEAMTVTAPINTLDHMSKVVSPLMERMVAAEVESRTLAAIRDYLLPKLISGELQCPPIEKSTERMAI